MATAAVASDSLSPPKDERGMTPNMLILPFLCFAVRMVESERAPPTSRPSHLPQPPEERVQQMEPGPPHGNSLQPLRQPLRQQLRQQLRQVQPAAAPRSHRPVGRSEIIPGNGTSKPNLHHQVSSGGAARKRIKADPNNKAWASNQGGAAPERRRKGAGSEEEAFPGSTLTEPV